jgi:diaminopimelate decarboxylase
MNYFHYKDCHLFAEDVPVFEIAKQWGTPCYVYSRAALEQNWSEFDDAFGSHHHEICYAVKANSNLAILNLLASKGSGFDIVSQGELERVLTAGGNPQHIIFSGVGKLVPEIIRALEVNIGIFNVESVSELFRLNEIAKLLKKRAPVSLRVNPDINVATHPYIATGLKENKFGIAIEDITNLVEITKTLPHIELKGIGYHIGSQLIELQPFLDAFDRIYELVVFLRKTGFDVSHLDIGGGLGIRYLEENPPSPREYIEAIIQRLRGDELKIMVEPGRAIAANAGILLTKVEYIKATRHKNFAIVDAAMNDLLRPSLYNAYQEIMPIEKKIAISSAIYDVVGPVCETGDFLGKDRLLAISEHDLLAVSAAGAYGFTMSSNYNSRPRIAEVMVDKDKMFLIRERETYDDLIRHERLLSSITENVCP